MHGFLCLQQSVLEHVVEAGIGALQDQRRECGNRGTGRGRHRVHHVVDTGTDVVQRIGHGRHGVEFAAAITQPQLRRAAQGNGYHRRVGRRRYRLCPTDFVIPEAVFRRPLGDGMRTIQTEESNQQPADRVSMREWVFSVRFHQG